MDNNKISVDTFNKCAVAYQEKYMDFSYYVDSFDKLLSYIPVGNNTLFEIGCGPGNITRYLLSMRPELTIQGIDLAPNMVQLARQNNPSATFEVMDCRDLDTLSGAYDVVVSGFCTPYLSEVEVEKLISDVRRCIKDDGIFYLSTMEGSDSDSGFQTNSKGDRCYIYYHHFKFLSKTLSENGFEILEVMRKDFPAALGVAATDLFIYAKAIQQGD